MDSTSETQMSETAVNIGALGPLAVGEDETGVGAAERERRRGQLIKLIDVLAPIVAADGGTLRLVDADYDAGRAVVELSGACASCAVSSVTLNAGVERLLRERLDWLVEFEGRIGADMGEVGTGDWRVRS